MSLSITEAATPPAPPAAVADVRFMGERLAFWRILIRGAALLAVTLGIYRFWLATDIRRYLWSHTEIAGDTLEYNGTPYELLIGFLIAIALLIPLNLALFVVALSLGPAGMLAGVLAFPLLALLGQFALYRARRYRLTRTVYRGIRCHQTGSAWAYALRAITWWLLVFVTLGLAYPFALASLERYKMRHTYYGNLGGRFEGSGMRLFARGLLMWLLVVGPLVAGLSYAALAVDWERVATIAKSGVNVTQRLEALPRFPEVVGVTLMAIGAGIVMAIVLFPLFQAVVMRWWLNGIRFGELTLTSSLRKRRIASAYLRFLGYSVLFSIAVSVVAGIVIIAAVLMLRPVAKPEAIEIVKAILGVGIYVTAMLGYSTIYQATVKLALWQRSLDSVTLTGLGALDTVTAEGAPGSAVGEGLADALNVGGF